jgi:tryptophan-rich sensory protein
MPIARTKSADILGLGGWITVCFAAAGMGSLATGQALIAWYPALTKPPGNPPNWVFGPVWTCLYLAMAIAAWRVWRRRGLDCRELVLFSVQLVLNVTWSLLFFGLRNPGAAVIDIALLWIAILVTTILFLRVDRLAGGLLLPYLAWVTFASYLNAAIWIINRAS